MEKQNELKNAIEKYLKRGFGSMNKNDFEVFIFNELLKDKYNNVSDNKISRELKIPTTKVKRLRYEADLMYPKEEDYYKNEFYSVLIGNSYKTLKPNKIQFCVKNKTLRLYLDDILESNGGFSDSSFNSDIVTITASDLLLLIAEFENENEIIQHIKNSIKDTSRPLPQDTKEKCINLVKAVTKDVAGRYVPNIVNFIAQTLNEQTE